MGSASRYCLQLLTEIVPSRESPAYQFETAKFRQQYYRHVSEGGWPFSTSAHGWPISDCSAEGLKGVLCLLRSKSVQDGINKNELEPIDEKRLEKAVNVMLSYQNEDGGKKMLSSSVSLLYAGPHRLVASTSNT